MKNNSNIIGETCYEPKRLRTKCPFCSSKQVLIAEIFHQVGSSEQCLQRVNHNNKGFVCLVGKLLCRTNPS